MKKGELYKCTWKRTWKDRLPPRADDWSNVICLYLGVNIIKRDDEQVVVNYRFLVNGKERIVDRTMLRYMQKIG